ncbi:MAG: phosphatase [Geobacteraceae bacterium GWC2_58_44]|nr:MAG: phosphatase [Geobacteraceae bacterium GWC2_58_44]HBG05836.1 phosphatase [Geobacter sp.]
MPRFHRYLAVVAVILGLLSTTTVARAQDTSLAGDILTGVIPVSALAIAYFKGDTEGEKQWLRNVIANQLLTSVARVGFNEMSWGERPTGNGYGFPSGHVAFVASGASFLQERYGWQYGVPAWLLTGYVAWNRVDNDHHHWRDVIASGVVAYGVGKLFVTPEMATHLAPVIGPDFIGLRFARSW